jgi:hypothetical protein
MYSGAACPSKLGVVPTTVWFGRRRGFGATPLSDPSKRQHTAEHDNADTGEFRLGL